MSPRGRAPSPRHVWCEHHHQGVCRDAGTVTGHWRLNPWPEGAERSNGYEIWRGPSRLRGHEGAPVVLIATGFDKGSTNRKTGTEIQTWIIRQDCPPTEAVRQGIDDAICGNCPLRPVNAQAKQRETGRHEAMCYVNTMFAPNNVYRTWKAGKYPTVDPVIAGQIAKTRHHPIRIGSYGDPAAIPPEIWDQLLALQEEHTGYTHQWRNHPEYARTLMASVGSEAEREQAKAMGFRTFRVLSGNETKAPGEIWCPASDVGGHKSQCDRCQLCSGSRGPTEARKDIAIYDHGPGGMRAGGMTMLPMAGEQRRKRTCWCSHPMSAHHSGMQRSRPRRLVARPLWTGRPR